MQLFSSNSFFGETLCHVWFWKKMLSKQSDLLAHFFILCVKKSQPTWNRTHLSVWPQPCRCHGNSCVVLERLHMFPDKWTQCCKINVFKRMEQLLLAAPAVASQRKCSTSELLACYNHHCSLWNLAYIFMQRVLCLFSLICLNLCVRKV